MIAVEIDVKGLDQATAMITALPAETGKAASRGVAKALVETRKLWALRLSGPATHTTLGVGTGHLRTSIGWEMFEPLAGRVGSNLIYSRIHEFGGVIVPRNPNGWLVFKIGKRWVKTKKVVMPRRPHREPAFRDAQRPIEMILSGAVDEGMAAAKARGDAVRNAQKTTAQEILFRGGSPRRTGRGGQPSILNNLLGLT